MEAKPETHGKASINGHLIVADGAHSIAMYERNGVSWIAEFHDGHGEVMNANAWFYFHAERLGYWRRRQAYRSTKPLPPLILKDIERLHREKEARERATAIGRCKMTLSEAAARLQRAVETADKANDRSYPYGQIPPRARTAMERLSGLMSSVRSVLSRTSRTAG